MWGLGTLAKDMDGALYCLAVLGWPTSMTLYDLALLLDTILTIHSSLLYQLFAELQIMLLPCTW